MAPLPLLPSISQQFLYLFVEAKSPVTKKTKKAASVEVKEEPEDKDEEKSNIDDGRFDRLTDTVLGYLNYFYINLCCCSCNVCLGQKYMILQLKQSVSL